MSQLWTLDLVVTKINGCCVLGCLVQRYRQRALFFSLLPICSHTCPYRVTRCYFLSKTYHQDKKVRLQYLPSLGSLTDKGFIDGGKGGSVVVDVQQADVDRHMTALTGIIWKANTGKVSCWQLNASLLNEPSHNLNCSREQLPALLKGTSPPPLLSHLHLCFTDIEDEGMKEYNKKRIRWNTNSFLEATIFSSWQAERVKLSPLTV